MDLPKRIEPDGLKDAIIELRFDSDIPFKAYFGVLFEKLGDSYQTIPGIEDIEEARRPYIRVGRDELFFNEKIRFQLLPGAIVFNCIEGYISWGKYFPEVKRVLETLLDTQIVSQITRVGVRYVSDHKGVALKDAVKLDFSFGLPEVQSDNYFFRSEFTFQDHRVILNVSNHDEGEDSPKPVSTIDIDVINGEIQTRNLDQVLKGVSDAHKVEKELFFSILQPDFLQSLNPQY